jgi:hypothetical protein
MDFLKGVCKQALIYFWVSVVVTVLVYLRSYDAGQLVWMALFIPFWTWLVNKLCKSNHEVLAWILGLFPIAGVLVTFAMGLLRGVGAAVKDTTDAAESPEQQRQQGDVSQGPARPDQNYMENQTLAAALSH